VENVSQPNSQLRAGEGYYNIAPGFIP
jgi:hypothetical protein